MLRSLHKTLQVAQRAAPLARSAGGFASHKDPHGDNDEHANFTFNEENQKKVGEIIAKYPEGYQQSAVMPLLDLAQRQCGGWLPLGAMDHVSKILRMPKIRTYEVASFYTMYQRQKIGKHFVQVCTTTPCMVRGAYDILETCKSNLGIGPGETTEDGMFTLMEMECAASCPNAPMVQIDDDYYEDLTEETTNALLDTLKAGKNPAVTLSQSGRKYSMPETGKTTLLSEPSGPRCDTL